jgi:hypothetical protein
MYKRNESVLDSCIKQKQIIVLIADISILVHIAIDNVDVKTLCQMLTATA